MFVVVHYDNCMLVVVLYRSIKLATCTYLLSLYTVTIHKGSKIIAQPVSYSLREASCACVYLIIIE